jgi:hypothetical protein
MSESGNAGAAGKGGAMLMNQPIVIDNGSATIKAGFAGGSKPKVRNFSQYWYAN